MPITIITRLTRIERRITQRRQQRTMLAYCDPVTFARTKLHFQPDDWQARVLQWEGKRLLLNCSRQSGKSTIISIFSLHHAVYVPRSLILLISPSLRQSAELFKKVQDFFSLLPVRPTLTEDNRLSMQLKNGSRIISLPSLESTIRGFSAVSLLIFDEASRVQDSLFHACKPMVAVSQGRVIAMSTPFGVRGFFHQEWTEGVGWDKVCVPASDCPRIPRSFLDTERRDMPDLWFRSEYCCEFVDTIESVFRLEDIDAALDPTIEPLFPVEVS